MVAEVLISADPNMASEVVISAEPNMVAEVSYHVVPINIQPQKAFLIP